MSHTYAQNVIHVVFSTKDLLQVSPHFNLSSRLGPFSSAEASSLRPGCYRAAQLLRERRMRGICLGIAPFLSCHPVARRRKEARLIFPPT
jgi:hypothetical protein